jgi:hypothetical protein
MSSQALTFAPPRRLVLQRALIEAIRIVTPTACSLFILLIMLETATTETDVCFFKSLFFFDRICLYLHFIYLFFIEICLNSCFAY